MSTKIVYQGICTDIVIQNRYIIFVNKVESQMFLFALLALLLEKQN